MPAKLNFYQPLLQHSLSHDPSEIILIYWFAAQETFSVASLEEITLWIQRVYRTYALDDAEERFPEFDSNNDGVVSWDEYNMVLHGHTVEVDVDAVLEDPEEESLRFVCCIIY